MNIERRIKKHIHGKPQAIRVTCAPGLEQACLVEVKALLQACDDQGEVTKVEGAILCSQIRYNSIQFILPRLRTGSRIFLRVAKRRCVAKHEFRGWVKEIPWPLYLPAEVQIVARSFRSKLYHESMLTELLCEAIPSASVAAATNPMAPRVECTLRHDTATIELELAGRSLSQRDYKAARTSLAPLKADVAAACIDTFQAYVGGDPATQVAVPFAGSGTLGFEYVLRMGLAPAQWRSEYAVRLCPFFREATWQHHLPKGELSHACEVTLIEKSPRQLASLKSNCTSFGDVVGPQVEFRVQQGDVFDVGDCSATVLMNPPYGDRLAADNEFFAKLAAFVDSQSHPGLCLLPNDTVLAIKRPHHTVMFRTGGKETQLLMWKP